MLVLAAQRLEVVRRKVDDQQSPAGPEHTRRFSQRGEGFMREVQDLVQDHEIKRVVFEIETVHVTLTDLHVPPLRSFEIIARDGQHLEAQIHTNGATRAVAEQVADLAGTDQSEDLGLDVAFGDVQRAQAMPVGGILAEIFGGHLGPRAPHAVELFAVPTEVGILIGEQFENPAGQCGAASFIPEPIENPASFAEALKQSAVDELL
jgi:hypothetical protein